MNDDEESRWTQFGIVVKNGQMSIVLIGKTYFFIYLFFIFSSVV